MTPGGPCLQPPDIAVDAPDTRQARLGRFLNAYWLRPENAFWMALRSEALGSASWDQPSVDLGCGDGIFTFLHAGGELDPAFDVFTAVGALDRVHSTHADMFDHFSDAYCPVIRRAPDWRIDSGTDLKSNLLAKAAALHQFDELVIHDHNRALPFGDGSFGTVHCNTAYWVEQIDAFLGEIRRIMRPDGRALLSIKLDSIRDCTLESFSEQLGERWLDLIGRGRFACWPTGGDADTWRRRFERAGLVIHDERPLVTRTHGHIWDIGLRPIAPLLVRMTESLTADTRASIKRDWVDLFTELLLPITRPDFDLLGGGEPVEICFDLRPA